MRRRHGVAALLAFASPVFAQSSVPSALREYTIDYGHSIVEFSVGFALTRVKGRFTAGKGTILYDEAHPGNSSVTMVLESKSIDTGWPHRDEHLRTDDFFDVEKFPTIVFQSERLTQKGDAWTMNGRLTMHGVTRLITLDCRLPRAPSRSAESGWMILNAMGTMRLARADFGILGGSTHNSWFTKARAATVSDSVDISLEVEGYLADAASQRLNGVDAVLDRIKSGGVQPQIDRLAAAKAARPTETSGLAHGGDLVVRGLIATTRNDDALKLSSALVELFPTSINAAAVRGLALAASGDTRGAAREYQRMKAIFVPPAPDPNERFPQDDENWYYLDQLARTTLEWGMPANGLPIARAAAELFPRTARAHSTLGVLLAATNDANGAADEFTKALAIDDRDTRALEWRRRLAPSAPR